RAGPSSSCSSVPSIVFGTVQSYRLPGMIRRFTDGDVEAAAELLAERHARHREAEPLLPADVDFRAQIESEWAVDGAGGVISSDGCPFARPPPDRPRDLAWVLTGLGGHPLAPPAGEAGAPA